MESKISVQIWEFECSQRALLSGIFWLVMCCIFVSSNGAVDQEERRALLQLRDSLNYPNGSALVNEWVGDDHCSWVGIFCVRTSNGDLRVLDISLTSTRQHGLGIWYPNASLISRFENLEFLYLAGNYIGGWVMPEALCRLSKLKLLDLSSNPLNGDIDVVPHFQICSLLSLEELQLSSIYPTGNHSISVLTALCGLKNLRSLDLSNNGINDGNAPPCLPSNFSSSLENLDLSGNHLQISPRILTDLCSLRRLRKLDLSDNFLDDVSIPSCLFHDQSLLESLDISQNNLKGSSNIISDICKLQNLQTLNLKGNSIQGGIDPCLSKLTSLVSLDLSFNSFVGKIPPSIFNNLTSLETLLISDNEFQGKLYFAALANLSKLRDIDLSNNDFSVITESPSWIPSFQLVSLNLRNCGLNKYHGGVVPSFISSQKKIKVISLSYNALRGALPLWLLYNTTVELLSLRANCFSGEIPLSSGLATSELLMLDVSDNQLHGQLPSTIPKLFPELYYINMSFNAFVGEIPSYGNLTSLEVLDLSNNFLQGEIPLSLRHNHTSLAQLVLSRNDFLGQNMPSFSNMSNLAYLLLQNVGFSGSISISNGLINLPILKILDLSWNGVSGNIPNWFDTFPNLGIILLSENQFHGTIPSSLCRLQKLHVLDLSANSLSGPVPSCLSNITSWKKQHELLLPSFMWLAASTYVNYRVKVSFNSQPYEGAPLFFVTAIDLSVNQLSGEIPSPLGELKALGSLNLSFNILSGHIPKSLATMGQIESLDLSHNTLEGSIPPEMIQLHFMSTFNVSYNNLGGSIPFEYNFQTFDESSYWGNAGLCGPPLHKTCGSQNKKLHQQEEEDKTGLAESDFFFYSCIAASYVVGFWGVILPLILSKSWRCKYYAGVDSCIRKFSGFWTASQNR